MSKRTRLKYTIKSHLANYPASEKAKIQSQVSDLAGISIATYNRYINLTDTDHNDIPGYVLQAFAAVLEVPITSLFPVKISA